MYYFLGIVTKQDLVKGRIEPSFTLCQSHGDAQTRSPWRVTKRGSSVDSMNRVLVPEMYGHQDMIDFLCSYRTRDHMHGSKKYAHEKTKKYYPVGALFWFPCDVYGTRNGPAVFIERVPKKTELRQVDQGFQRLKQAWSRKKPMKEVLSQQRRMDDLETTHVKPKLYQDRIPPSEHKSFSI